MTHSSLSHSSQRLKRQGRRSMKSAMKLLSIRGGPAAVAAAFFAGRSVIALDNGLRIPPMGWSSWYGFTTNINETMVLDMAHGMITSGLRDAGYDNIWIDDGYVIGRHSGTGRLVVDPSLFPAGMRNLSDRIHSLGLKFGVYTNRGLLTCLGYKDTEPDRPGSCGYEYIDADTYANDWRVDQVKFDGCGSCPSYRRDPYVAIRDALNQTGRRVWLSINGLWSDPTAPSLSNDWRTGDDLYDSTYGTWTDRLDSATTDAQRAMAGPGALPNPDFLEVGYSPRMPRGTTTLLEQRSMFTLWAALPAPLILSADLRPGAKCGGIDDAVTMETLTNREVIAVNQDQAAHPMRPVVNDTENGWLQVWAKPLAKPGSMAVVFFHRTNRTAGKMPSSPEVKTMSVQWSELGLPDSASVIIRDLWAKRTLGTYAGRFERNIAEREARIYTFTLVEKRGDYPIARTSHNLDKKGAKDGMVHFSSIFNMTTKVL